MATLPKICIWCVIVAIAVSYPHYYPYVPNSRNVPYTCPGAGPNEKFLRIGHWPNFFERNPFGQNFSLDWTVICDLDPDMDNRTSGEELGDPNCQWIHDNVTTHTFLTEATSNPGIAEEFVNGKYVVLEHLRGIACPEAFILF
ncbi:temptin-like [Mizuhopecten yessoensis]|uniref:Temptin n=1 Tax=Mizuhopecten yessoensis TaxID=6573 RepID=A0A210PMU5_MIZYE|nr:temptin-like [Mizuhopecten yessoensis]OWF37812.1 Temptin [Mizuhopecten yessoensis]